MQSFEVMSPSPDRAHSAMDHDNGVALESGLGSLGLEIRRHGRLMSPAGAAPSGSSLCSKGIRLVVPAPTRAGAKPVRRSFQFRGIASDRRADIDRLKLECSR
jgi:hypothetical protein